MGALVVVNPSQRRTEWLTARKADRGSEFVLNRISIQVRVPTILMGSELIGLQFPLEHLDGGRRRRLRDVALLGPLGEIPSSGNGQKGRDLGSRAAARQGLIGGCRRQTPPVCPPAGGGQYPVAQSREQFWLVGASEAVAAACSRYWPMSMLARTRSDRLRACIFSITLAR
jgi:hypothetical protein